MNNYFTYEEIKWLEENYETCTPEEAEKRLGRTWGGIRGFCSRKKIKRRKFRKVEVENVPVHIIPNNVSVYDLIEIKDLMKEIGKSRQELDMWMVIYSEEFKVYRRKGKLVFLIDEVLAFLEKYQEIWDATKVQKDFFDECEWFEKKHKEDFERMIKNRWGSWAK